MSKFYESFPLQRLFLNKVDNLPTYADIKTEWPCLLDPFYLSTHFKLLTNCDVELLAGTIKSDVPNLLAFGTMKGFLNLDDELTDHEKNVGRLVNLFGSKWGVNRICYFSKKNRFCKSVGQK